MARLKIINLISGPRNISTAMMYSFAQRKGCMVLDEPFYAVYLEKTGVNHPGREEVLRSMPGNEASVRSHISSLDAPLLFIKNMAHHCQVLEEPLVLGATNVFLIRDPAFIINSYIKVIAEPEMRDLGIAYQHQLFVDLLSRGEHPIVLDTGEVLKNPDTVLRQLCKACDIPFDKGMLRWKKGPKPYDGAWARHWYGNVHKSTGFGSPVRESWPVPERLRDLYEQSNILYEKLAAFSLKA